MQTTLIKNARFQNLYGKSGDWASSDPTILTGELALVSDDEGDIRIKVGVGKRFTETDYIYSMDRWTTNHNTLPNADDSNIKPSGSIGHNTEDYIQASGNIIYPINLTTSVRLSNGSKLQTWMNDVSTNNITMTGDLYMNRNGSSKPVLRVVSDSNYGTDIAITAGGNTIISSGEADSVIEKVITPLAEQLFIASDDSVRIFAKCQTASGYKTVTFSGESFSPETTDDINLGSLSYRWNNIYANSLDLLTSITVPDISIKDNTTTTAKGITGTTGNDYWRMGGALSTANSASTGFMEVATSGSGNEPIYVRQYTGKFATIVKTLTLLDASGNTQFPGIISEKGTTLENKYIQRSGVLPMTGNLNIASNSIVFKATNSESFTTGTRFKNYDDTTYGEIGFHSNNGVGDYMYIGFGDDPYNVAKGVQISNTVFKYKNNTIWHSGNDGTSSGLDADLLDGKHASAFSLTSHTHTKSQITDFPASLKNPYALNIQLNGVAQGTYDGSVVKTINITPESIGAASKGNGLTFVEGTQTGITGSWKGNAPSIEELYDGLTILYWLPYNGSGYATLELTIANGVSTGAVACYYKGSSRLTTHYQYGDVILFTYRKDVTMNGSSTKYTGWWANANYVDGNTYDRIRLNRPLKAKEDITGGSIIVSSDTSGYVILNNSLPDINLSYPLLYAGTNIAAGATDTVNYPFYSNVPISVIWTFTGIAYAPLYLKGKLNGYIFKPNSTMLTCTIPTTDDGFEYLLLGYCSSTTIFTLITEHPIFKYMNGTFTQISAGAMYSSVAEKVKAGLTISLNGTSQGLFDGSAAKSINITAASVGAAVASHNHDTVYSKLSHTHTKSQITDFPASLKNPTAIVVKLNGGTTEGTNMFTYDGSAAKSLNITASLIGAALTSHTHNYAGSSSAGGNANAAVKLATARKIGNANFDGTTNITAAQMGVAPANLVYKNITIATSAWNTSTNIYEYANASITANHVPQVFFSTASLDAAGKAGITVYTEAGKLVFKCTTIPTVSLVIESAILTPV